MCQKRSFSAWSICTIIALRANHVSWFCSSMNCAKTYLQNKYVCLYCTLWMCTSCSAALPSSGMTRRQELTRSNTMVSPFLKPLKPSSIPLLVVVDASGDDEARDAVIALDRRWNLLFVAFVEREDDYIRIVSARKATRKEREYYEA